MQFDPEEIVASLGKHLPYEKLISRTEEGGFYLKSFTFELIFAYISSLFGVLYDYEMNVNPDNNTTVDFVYELNRYKMMCFELLRPEMSNVLKAATKSQETGVGGVKSFQLTLEGGHPVEHLRPQAQTIRLQEKLLEKVEKFPEPNDDVFCTIVVDCSEFHFGRLDRDDCCTVMYGKTINPLLQEYWGSQPILGLLDTKLETKMASEFRRKVTGVIFIPKISNNELKDSYLTLNSRRDRNHLELYIDALRQMGMLDWLQVLPLIK